jgi:hypothetical protein
MRFSGGESEISRTNGVDPVGLELMRFGIVNIVIRSGVDYQVRISRSQSVAYLLEPRDIELLMPERDEFVVTKGFAESKPELPTTSRD